MNTLEPFSQTMQHAVAQVLRPLFRLLLRNGMSFGAFEEIAKKPFVDVALHEFSIPGKKPSISRASILSGLSRKEVQRLIAKPALPDADALARHNRAARVITGWIRDPEFLNANRQPRTLEAQGPVSFETLVRRHSGDMPTRAVLDELIRVGVVHHHEDDFDACKSIVKRGNSGQYNLKPVVAFIPVVSSAGMRVVGYLDPPIAVASTSVSFQANGLPVKATVPIAPIVPDATTGRFELYPVPVGTYDLMVTAVGHVTAVMTGVPVASSLITTINSTTTRIVTPTAT